MRNTAINRVQYSTRLAINVNQIIFSQQILQGLSSSSLFFQAYATVIGSIDYLPPLLRVHNGRSRKGYRLGNSRSISPGPNNPPLQGKVCKLHCTWVCFPVWLFCRRFSALGFFPLWFGFIFSNARPLLLRVTLDVRQASPHVFANYVYLFSSMSSDVCCNTPFQLEWQWAVVEQPVKLPAKNLVSCLFLLLSWWIGNSLWMHKNPEERTFCKLRFKKDTV